MKLNCGEAVRTFIGSSGIRSAVCGTPGSDILASTWFYKHKENQDESPSSIKPSAMAIHCWDEANRSGTEQDLYEEGRYKNRKIDVILCAWYNDIR